MQHHKKHLVVNLKRDSECTKATLMLKFCISVFCEVKNKRLMSYDIRQYVRLFACSLSSNGDKPPYTILIKLGIKVNYEICRASKNFMTIGSHTLRTGVYGFTPVISTCRGRSESSSVWKCERDNTEAEFYLGA